jgi:hypothetical protein
MKHRQLFRLMLSEMQGGHAQHLELFAFVNLGLVQSLASGVISPTEAIHRFYHADNCLYVQKHFRSKEAAMIMSHGIQLPDLFESLSAEEAQREFYHELEVMRSLCLKLLQRKRSPGVADRAAA